jgi:c-di-GMP-binding flagellar brake protein YcgR
MHESNDSDRRRFTRHEVALPVRIIDGGREIAGETLDISGGGMSLKLASDLSPGNRVKVVIGNLGEFSANVLSHGGIDRLALDISEDDQHKLADDIVCKLAEFLPV